MERVKDKPTIDRIKTAHPALREELSSIYNEIEEALTGRARVRFTRIFRTFQEQDLLYAQGRIDKTKKIVTNAKGGESFHNYGLAVDICLLLADKNGNYKEASWDTKSDFDGDGISDWIEIVKIFKLYGWAWGGDWKFVDYPHFEKTFGLFIKELKTRVVKEKCPINKW